MAGLLLESFRNCFFKSQRSEEPQLGPAAGLFRASNRREEGVDFIKRKTESVGDPCQGSYVGDPCHSS